MKNLLITSVLFITTIFILIFSDAYSQDQIENRHYLSLGIGIHSNCIFNEWEYPKNTNIPSPIQGILETKDSIQHLPSISAHGFFYFNKEINNIWIFRTGVELYNQKARVKNYGTYSDSLTGQPISVYTYFDASTIVLFFPFEVAYAPSKFPKISFGFLLGTLYFQKSFIKTPLNEFSTDFEFGNIELFTSFNFKVEKEFNELLSLPISFYIGLQTRQPMDEGIDVLAGIIYNFKKNEK